MSNDSWFTEHEMGAEMHHFVAAFRSIETRLPQFRVTTNGYSAVIDSNGTVIAGSRLGERALVVANAPVGAPPKTLMVILGNWVGPAGATFLALLATMVGLRRLKEYQGKNASRRPISITLPTSVSLVSRRVRFVIGILQTCARCGVIGLGVTMLLDSTLTGITVTHIKVFVSICLIPEALAWAICFIYAAQSRIENGALVLTRGKDRFEIPLSEIRAIEPWRLPVPGAGFALRLSTGETWPYDFARANSADFSAALTAAGSKLIALPASTASNFVEARMANRPRLWDHPFTKFVLLSCGLAIPAFVLHQNIGYGSAFGEYFAFGLKAYLLAFAIWWAAWAIGVVLIAAILRTGIEIGTLLSVVVRPGQAPEIRRWLEGFAHIALYVGTPTWLLFRIFGS